MVGQWLPEPPIEGGSHLSDEISAPSLIIVDSDYDDVDGIEIVENDIETVANYNEYRLLSDGDNLTDEEGADDSDEGEPENPVQLEVFVEVHPHRYQSSSDEQPIKLEIIVMKQFKSSADEPRDIAVDCDQVRAAMANITLPDSATPSWAGSIPDSEWCLYLQNRIRSLQERSNKSSASK